MKAFEGCTIRVKNNRYSGTIKAGNEYTVEDAKKVSKGSTILWLTGMDKDGIFPIRDFEWHCYESDYEVI